MFYHLGFDFYGAGNVGDDLMLAGFLDVLPEALLLQGVTGHPPSQQRRFPRVRWSVKTDRCEMELITKASAWIGVGDTPFQMTSGPWFLNELNASLPIARSRNIGIAMIGVGAEKEALTVRPFIAKLLDQVDVIWTRDEMSSDLLSTVAADPTRIQTGADLAHITLSRMPRWLGHRPYSIGIGYYSESATENEISALASFIEAASSSRTLCCISNEFRPQFEVATYIRLLRHIGKRKPRLHRWWRQRVSFATGAAGTVPLFAPEYLAGAPVDFVTPYAKCDVVLSSRYHGILSAAWAGCRVGILGGRSSKLDGLASQFGIPMIKPPYAASAIEDLAQAAVQLPRNRLEIEANKAIASVHALVRWLPLT